MSISGVGKDECGYLFEEGGAGEIGNIVSDFEVPMCASTLGVDDTLRDALPVKVGEEIDVVKVCKWSLVEDDDHGTCAHPGAGGDRGSRPWRLHRAE